MTIAQRTTTPDSVDVFSEITHSTFEPFLGNLGQDITRQFGGWTIDFRAMTFALGVQYTCASPATGIHTLTGEGLAKNAERVRHPAALSVVNWCPEPVASPLSDPRRPAVLRRSGESAALSRLSQVLYDSSTPRWPTTRPHSSPRA